LGADCGISAVTAREWLAVLEASYLVTRLPPYFQNFGKRLVKTPKLYFLDVGLMAWLLGIRDEASMATHAARGALFETWVVSELIKQRFNAGQPADLYFWRDSAGHEIDVVFESAAGLQALEIKSGSTFAADWVDGLKKWQKFTGDTPTLKPILIYGGNDSHEREQCLLTAWKDMTQPWRS